MLVQYISPTHVYKRFGNKYTKYLPFVYNEKISICKTWWMGCWKVLVTLWKINLTNHQNFCFFIFFFFSCLSPCWLCWELFSTLCIFVWIKFWNLSFSEHWHKLTFMSGLNDLNWFGCLTAKLMDSIISRPPMLLSKRTCFTVDQNKKYSRKLWNSIPIENFFICW